METFLTGASGAARPARAERVLASMLFTDLVGSTTHAANLGVLVVTVTVVLVVVVVVLAFSSQSTSASQAQSLTIAAQSRLRQAPRQKRRACTSPPHASAQSS
jgi:hypothetical protein